MLANLDAERALLSCMLQSAQALDDAGDIQPDDFYSPAYRQIFQIIAEIRRKGDRPIDIVTVGDEMARVGGSALFESDDSLFKLASHASTWHAVRSYAAIVLRDGAKRRFIATCEDLKNRAAAGEDALELASAGRGALAELESRRDGGPVRVGDKLSEAWQQIQDRAKNPDLYRVPTGISRYDNEIGGMCAPRLIVVAARPGMGKTAWAGTVSVNATSKGIPTLIFSLEMDFGEMVERIIGQVAGITVENIHRGQIALNERSSILSALPRIKPLPLYLDDRVLTMAQICATARMWKARLKSNRALVVIDYLGLIKTPTGARGNNRNNEIGEMACSAKHLAKDLKIPVVLVSQLNRESEKDGMREPRMSDLRDSGEIEQHADQILFPWRAPQKQPDGTIQPAHGSGPAQLIVSKNRGGRTGAIDVWWEAEQMKFRGMGVDEK